MIRAALCLLGTLLTLLSPLVATARPPWESISWWGDLDRAERGRVEKLAQEKRSYGDCSDTVATCFERGTKSGRRLARLIIYLVQKGATDEDVSTFIDQRRASATGAPKAIDTTLAPLFGPADAPVVVAEFADFECPFCARVTPVLKEVIAAEKGKARLYFKHFPLKTHVNSVPAALAAVAAQKVGKFWDMAALLFGDLDAHDQKHLEGYAAKLGIPLDTFRGLVKDPATMNTVVKDKEAGLRLGVSATPTVYVNGREVRHADDRVLLQDAIEEELERLSAKR